VFFNITDGFMAFNNTDKTKSVKRVIGGKAFNTATAELIHRTRGNTEVIYDLGGEYYDDEQELYRTRHGAYFILQRDKLVHVGGDIGHDFEDQITPCSHDEAKKWLETYCNEMVDDFFNIPEAGSSETFISLRTTETLAKDARILAKIKNSSLNTLINLLIKEAINKDISEIISYKEKQRVREVAAQKLINATGTKNN